MTELLKWVATIAIGSLGLTIIFSIIGSIFMGLANKAKKAREDTIKYDELIDVAYDCGSSVCWFLILTFISSIAYGILKIL